jgi:hypothetical protein
MSDIEYQESEIKRILHQMKCDFEELNHHQRELKVDDGFSSIASEVRDLESSFCYLAKRVFFLCNAYFESKKLYKYLEQFNLQIVPLLKTNKKTLQLVYREDTGLEHSLLLDTIWDLLYSFSFTLDENDEAFYQRLGIRYLENILESTDTIIEELQVNPKTEISVYNYVKIVIKAVFPNASFPSESFQKTAKNYKPDILLAGLCCAIEYKFADTEKKLINAIDQILSDVQGYANHSTYKTFYAVFYVKKVSWTKARFDAVWKEKKFPINWKYIFIKASQ